MIKQISNTAQDLGDLQTFLAGSSYCRNGMIGNRHFLEPQNAPLDTGYLPMTTSKWSQVNPVLQTHISPFIRYNVYV